MVATGVLFADLSPKAREHALDRYRDWNAGHEWWDGVYEDAKCMAALMGIAIENIFFSGFWSQGDGASFVGWYNPKADAIASVQAECNDETLLDLARRLTVIQVAMALTFGFERMHSKITTRGHYSHSGTMSVETEVDSSEVDFPDEFDEEITACMREFADWIYKNLEAEYEHLTSDEHLAETFANDETMFDEDGDMI